MRISQSLTDTDRRLVASRLEDFLPPVIYDIHAHPHHPEHFRRNPFSWLENDPPLGCREFRDAMTKYLPGRPIDGLFFGMPQTGCDRGQINAWVSEEVRSRGTPLSRALAVVSPADDPVLVREIIRSGNFVGIKVYHVFADRADSFDALIEEYAPEWMWELCHDIEGVLMLHLVRNEAIADRGNMASLARLGRRYPSCRVVLAHVARSFNYRHGLAGLRGLREIDNVWVDTSAVTEADAMREAIRVLGPGRVLYGSDYPVSELRGRCVTTGENFFWLHPELIQPGYRPPTAADMPLVGIESLLCLREACEECGLTEPDIQGIFRGNALRLLAPHLPAVEPAAPPEGTDLWKRAKASISCGTGLMSKRAEMFDPVSWPSYFSRCSGCQVWDSSGRRFTDFAGGVGAILLGYADPDVTSAVRRRLDLGTYCTLVSPDEPELAGLLLELHPWARRVRFARGGGEALAMAVRIARAATGRSGVAFCGYHGWQDWYLAANLANESRRDGQLLPGLTPLGVPRELHGTSVPFQYNDIASLEDALRRLDGRLAAVVMEPLRSQWPADGFFEEAAARCRAAGAVFVVDEVTSGWRFGFPGASSRLGVEPDIAVYAKAMSNGFPCAAVIGHADVMDAANRSFISSSYWTDGVGPAAALAAIRKIRADHVQADVWKLGVVLQTGLQQLSSAYPCLNLRVGGMPAAPSLTFDLGRESAAARALMIRKMLSRGYLMSGQLYVMQAHDALRVDAMLSELNDVLDGISDSLQSEGLAPDERSPEPAGFARLA